MQIKTLLAAAVATLAPAFVSAQAGFCPEAARFGVPIVTPTTLAPGDPFTVVTNFTCSFSRDIIPLFVDYWIEVPVNNNGHEPNILLARKTFEGNASFPIDSINTTVPFAFYFPNQEASDPPIADVPSGHARL